MPFEMIRTPENLFSINGKRLIDFINENKEHLTVTKDSQDFKHYYVYCFNIPVWADKNYLEQHTDINQLPEDYKNKLKQENRILLGYEDIKLLITKEHPQILYKIINRGKDSKEITIEETMNIGNGILFPKRINYTKGVITQQWTITNVSINKPISNEVFECNLSNIPKDYIISDEDSGLIISK